MAPTLPASKEVGLVIRKCGVCQSQSAWQPAMMIAVIDAYEETRVRIRAVYGGFFLALSLLWGWYLDRNRPDVTGAAIALTGVCVTMYWPKTSIAPNQS